MNMKRNIDELSKILKLNQYLIIINDEYVADMLNFRIFKYTFDYR